MSSVDRASAAKGLSKVQAGLGVTRLESMMTGFLANTGCVAASNQTLMTQLNHYLFV